MFRVEMRGECRKEEVKSQKAKGENEEQLSAVSYQLSAVSGGNDCSSMKSKFESQNGEKLKSKK